MKNNWLSIGILASAASIFFQPTLAFSVMSPFHSGRPNCQRLNAQRGRAVHNEPNFLLQEFATHSGEVIDPYRVLKLPRTADRSQIKDSYRTLSRRYHPDSVRHKDILPGRCNDLDEVRDEWERIKLAYEILNDTRTRKRYDRHEMLADPGAAVQRAALGAIGKGLSDVAKGVGKGIVSVGLFTFNQLTKDQNEEPKEQEKRA